MSRLWPSNRLRSAGVLVCLALALSGCTLRTYGVARGIHYVTGATIRVHLITPLVSRLSAYRVIEVPRFENMLPDQVSGPMEDYLHDRIASELHSVTSSPAIRSTDDGVGVAGAGPRGSVSAPTLVLEGILDDYEPGYVGLRLVELGFNHVAVTVRFRLRDKSSGRVLGAASVTAQDNRFTATTDGAINRLARRVRAIVDAGYRG